MINKCYLLFKIRLNKFVCISNKVIKFMSTKTNQNKYCNVNSYDVINFAFTVLTNKTILVSVLDIFAM